MYPIGYGKGFLRWVGMIISGLVLLLGYIWILIDKKNQGWHDKIAGTYVIKE
jgi:RDD family.